MVSFSVEVIKVDVKKTLSNDREYKIVLVTNEPMALNMAQYINEVSLQATFEPLE